MLVFCQKGSSDVALVALFNLLLAAMAIPLLQSLPDSWWSVIAPLFLVQFLSFSPLIKKNLKYAKDLLLPSSIFLMYIGLNFTLGAYFISLDRGVNSSFGSDLKVIKNYILITEFYLLINFLAFWATIYSLRKANKKRMPMVLLRSSPVFLLGARYIVPSSLLISAAFIVFSLLDPLLVFSIQLLLLLIQVILISESSRLSRMAVYLAYLILFTTFNYANKREIAVALMAIVYFELSYSNVRAKLSLKSVIVGGVLITFFSLLVMAASILRGYGGFEVAGALDAFLLLPQYIGSDIFLDALVENFELSYVFAAAYLAAEHVINGQIGYQLGLSYLKPLFFFFDRDVYWWKPDSVMILFTKNYDPAFYSLGGSYPILSPTEAFVNFHYFGAFVIGVILLSLNRLFVQIEAGRGGIFFVLSRLILVFTFFFYIRGSGVDLYFLYFLFSLPFLLLLLLLEKMLKS